MHNISYWKILQELKHLNECDSKNWDDSNVTKQQQVITCAP